MTDVFAIATTTVAWPVLWVLLILGFAAGWFARKPPQWFTEWMDSDSYAEDLWGFEDPGQRGPSFYDQDAAN